MDQERYEQARLSYREAPAVSPVSAPRNLVMPPQAAGTESGQRQPPFESLLSAGPLLAGGPAAAALTPYVSDLNLDQVVEAITAKREEPEFLRRHYLAQLHDEETISYRQEIFRDLEDPTLNGALMRFAQSMHRVRSHIDQIQKMRFRHQQEGWLLDAASLYCESVTQLHDALGDRRLRSRGLRSFGEYLAAYVRSDPFTTLLDDMQACKRALHAIRYTVRIRAGRVDVGRYDGEPDYSAEVESVFDRFKQGAVKDYRVNFRGWPGMNDVGGQILDLVARLFGDEFAMVETFCQQHNGFFDRTVRIFERELQFYLSYIEYIEPLRLAGLEFCLPEVSGTSKAIHAGKHLRYCLGSQAGGEKTPVVLNDLRLERDERIFVVSGPNQGGKTTFARTVGQLHHLASIGCPVPGRSACLFLFDEIFTHFEREEDLTRMRGKLEDDLIRIHEILERATTDSIVVMNEIFTSTTLNDARFLGARIMERIIELELICVFVTFVDEIASLGETVVSMMSTIVPANPSERTYKVVRSPANGLAYAMALAEKHDLTYDRLKIRLNR